MAVRYKRGDKHPSNAQLFFLRYLRGKEQWVSLERLSVARTRSIAADKLWKKTPKGTACARNAANRAYLRLKEYYSSYWKRPDVRQRVRDKHNSKPEVIARREARIARQKELIAYRASDEYKALLKERNHEKWLKRKAQGKTRAHDRKRWHNNPQHRLAQNMRRRVRSALTGYTGVKQTARTFELIGCSISALRVHLESQFVEGMTWGNYGSAWHVDHFIPVARFDLTDENQQRQAFFFENLQPLWKPDNQRKSDRVTVDGKEVKGRDIRKIIQFKAA